MRVIGHAERARVGCCSCGLSVHSAQSGALKRQDKEVRPAGGSAVSVCTVTVCVQVTVNTMAPYSIVFLIPVWYGSEMTKMIEMQEEVSCTGLVCSCGCLLLQFHQINGCTGRLH